MLRFVSVCALAALAALSAFAQERVASESQRGAYVVKHAAAKELAGILAKHFKGVAEIQAGPEGTSNCLLISASPAVFSEVMKTVEQMDQRPRTVAVDLFIVELAAPKEKADDKDKRPDEKDFGGPIDDVSKRLDEMMRKGQAASFKRFRLTALEGLAVSATLGENKPFVMGVTVTAKGSASRQLNYHNVGTQIKVTPRVAADRTVTLDLNVQDNRGQDSATATVGKDEKGNAIPATDFILTTLADKISVASGKAALAKEVKVVSKEGHGQTLIIVGARLLAAEPH